jgi:hypothetical protein
MADHEIGASGIDAAAERLGPDLLAGDLAAAMARQPARRDWRKRSVGPARSST